MGVKTSIALASVLVLGLLSSSARADLAPPGGSKRIGYQFTPTISGDTTSQVVFSYPCSGSSGAPDIHVTPLVSGRGVGVGSHESCQIYVVAKDAYDAWAKDAGASPDARADLLIAQAKVCSGNGPVATHTVPATDPRTSINDSIEVKVTAGSCTVTTLGAAPPPAASSAPASPEKKGGCNASGSSSFPLLLALPALVLLLKKRRE